MALQRWQLYLAENAPELERVDNLALALAPIADASYSVRNHPEYLELIKDVMFQASVVWIGLTGRELDLGTTKDAASDDFQTKYGHFYACWMLLRPYWQGQNPVACDAAEALSIQLETLNVSNTGKEEDRSTYLISVDNNINY